MKKLEFISLHHEVITNRDLSKAQMILLCLIYSLDKIGQNNPTNLELSLLLKCNVRTIERLIKVLVSIGLIELSGNRKNREISIIDIIQNNNFSKLPLNLIEHQKTSKLRDVELILWSIINRYQDYFKEGESFGCNKNNYFFSNLLDVSLQSISNYIFHLKEIKYLYVNNIYNQRLLITDDPFFIPTILPSTITKIPIKINGSIPKDALSIPLIKI